MSKFGVDAAPKFRLVQNDKDAMVVSGTVAVDAEQGHFHDVSLHVIAIDKYTDQMTFTTVSTAHPAKEMKGNCAQ